MRVHTPRWGTWWCWVATPPRARPLWRWLWPITRPRQGGSGFTAWRQTATSWPTGCWLTWWALRCLPSSAIRSPGSSGSGWPTSPTGSGPGSWSWWRPAVCQPRIFGRTPWPAGTRSCMWIICSSSSRRPARPTAQSRCPGSAGASSSWPTVQDAWWWPCPSSPGRSIPAKTSRWSPPCPTCGSPGRSSRTRTPSCCSIWRSPTGRRPAGGC